MKDTEPTLIIILGPTAVGKTEVATQVASKIEGEIISADSRQVYRGLNLGTGKDLDQYTIKGKSIPSHLIDICEPETDYNLHRFQKDFVNAFEDITSRGKASILCGGTGLYIQSVLQSYNLPAIPNNPQLTDRLSGLDKKELINKLSAYHFPEGFVPDQSTVKRLKRAIEIGEYLKSHELPKSTPLQFSPIIFGLKMERQLLRQRITSRLEQRLKEGLIEEVEGLLRKGITSSRLRYFGLEYKFITDYLEGYYSKNEMIKRLNTAIHQFAKRQMTWFRKMEREGYHIHWVEALQPLEDKVKAIVDKSCG